MDNDIDKDSAKTKEAENGLTSISPKMYVSTVSKTFLNDPEKKEEGGGDIKIETALYKRRWYVMLVFSVLTMVQGGLWNTWGPIAESSEKAFDWTDGDIALFTNWGPIGYLIATFPLAWLIDVKGFRPACLLASILVAVGACIRCITSTPPYTTWTINIAQCLNGLAGPVCMGGPPVLSALWFPIHERTTATAFQTVFNYLGVGLSFIIGPAVIRQDNSIKNVIVANQSRNTTNTSLLSNSSDNNNIQEINALRNDIMILMYWECGVAVLTFLLVLVYFPSKPDLPPTISAFKEKVEFKKAFRQLARNERFWLICLTFGVSLGIFNCWEGVLDVLLKPYGFSETEAGWLGFYALLAGCFVSLLVSRFADIFTKHMRLFLICLYIGASVMIIWFTLLLQGIIASNTAQLYSSITLFQTFIQSTAPLYFEMACETTYPVGEGITNLVLTLVNNIGGGIFLLIQMVPNIGTAWSNWCLLGAIVSCIPVLGFLKERYNRLEVDEIQDTKDDTNKL